jgi:hypothetical protein
VSSFTIHALGCSGEGCSEGCRCVCHQGLQAFIATNATEAKPLTKASLEAMLSAVKPRREGS